MAAGVIKDLRTFSVAVNAAFKTAVQGQFKGDPLAPLTTVVPMQGVKEIEFPIAGVTGPMREWKGSRIVTSIMRDSYRIKTKKFEKTLGIDVDDIQFDNLDVFMPGIQTYSTQLAAWRTQQMHKALEANLIGYDEQPFFSTTHQVNGLNVSNYQAGVGPAFYVLDDTKPLKPLLWGETQAPVMKAKTSDSDDNVFWRDQYIWGAKAIGGPGVGLWQTAYKSKGDLDEANLENIITTMRDAKDEEGETLDIVPTVLLIPPSLLWDAQRLLGRATNPDGTENIHQGSLRIVVSNRLTGI